MKTLKAILWIAVSVLAAVSFAGAAHLFNPSEKVSALWILSASACFFLLSYRFYAAFIAAKVLSLDPKFVTPAHRLRDGIDYEPTHRLVLFGHHFAAIAGAGPLIGPMLAAQFGYLPGFLWIVIGSALAGAVHDMVILAASVRRGGRSLPSIAREEIGPVGGIAASLAVIFIILVALAGLGLAVVNALTMNPWGTFTIAVTIPIALLMGFYLFRFRVGKVGEVSVIGVILLSGAVIFGHFIPGSPLGNVFSLSSHSLIFVLAAYGFAASVLPVWMLLCPRDYLSTYMKIGTIALLAVGIIVMAPRIQMPAFTQFVHGGGPIIPGKLYPFMFITIACGAISGFHSLIASGTTPKMIMSEKDIPFIGYGSMVVEGVVGIMALIAATVLVPGDYFSINTHLSAQTLASMGFPVDRIKELSALVGINVEGRPGGAVSLAVGMASILSNIPGMKGLMPYWYNFALMFEALFILTTVDAGTRVARFLLQEISGSIWAPLGRQRSIPGIVFFSAAVSVSWAYLIFSGNVSTIWPMFGVANQILAGVALGVATVLIIKSGKLKYAWVTFIPMVFMFVTSLTAAWQLLFIFRAKAAAATAVKEAFNYNLDFALVLSMAVLAIIALMDIAWKGVKLLKPERR